MILFLISLSTLFSLSIQTLLTLANLISFLTISNYIEPTTSLKDSDKI